MRRTRTSALLALLVLCGCIIIREYDGTPLRADPALELRPGVTGMADVLSIFGPPDRIVRQSAGDVFIYRFQRRNSETFVIEEPVITDFQLFRYSRTREKEDRLVVLFGGDGRVQGFGYQRGTAELDGR